MNEFKLEDLWIGCTNCQETGRVQTSAGDMFVHVMEDQVCPVCRGQRGRITPMGDAILQFLDKMNFRRQH